MKCDKLFFILFCFFLFSCVAPTTPGRAVYPKVSLSNSDLDILIKLYPTRTYSRGCQTNLTIKNKTSKTFNSVYVEASIYDERGVNIDMVNFSVRVNPQETIERDRTFFKHECYEISDVKITKSSYR
jgi:hypothetical protein